MCLRLVLADVAMWVLGRQNQPLFIRSYGRPNATAEEDLKWHFVAHTSLDVFEERGVSDHHPGAGSGLREVGLIEDGLADCRSVWCPSK